MGDGKWDPKSTKFWREESHFLQNFGAKTKSKQINRKPKGSSSHFGENFDGEEDRFRDRRSKQAMKRFGQSSLPSSFLRRSPSTPPTGGDDEAKKPRKSISLSEFLDRKVGKAGGKSIKEKPSSFSWIASGRNDSGGKKDEPGGGFVLDAAVFRRFSQPATDEASGSASGGGVADGSRKRKSPFRVSADEDERPRAVAARSLVVLGDDPKPKTKKRGREAADGRNKRFYNHYESGCGWWEGEKEGVDNEEVGCNDVWEGMGSTTLGGLEWH